MKTALRNIIDLLIPPKCHLCGEVLMPGECFVCGPCAAMLPRTNYQSVKDNPVELRFAGKFPFERASGHFFYTRDSSVASLIHDFKYRNFPSLARRMGNLIEIDLRQVGYLNDIDVIIPIPLHWRKRMRRGYNQTEYLAMGLADKSGVAVSTDLKAVKGHSTQTNLTPDERRRNTEGIFRLRHPERYAGKHILLVDDVCTTGATLTAAADAILAEQPEAKLSLLTLACTF